MSIKVWLVYRSLPKRSTCWRLLFFIFHLPPEFLPVLVLLTRWCASTLGAIEAAWDDRKRLSKSVFLGIKTQPAFWCKLKKHFLLNFSTLFCFLAQVCLKKYFNQHLWKSFSWVFKRGLILFYYNNFLKFFIFLNSFL